MQGTKELRCTVSLDFGSLTRKERLEERVRPGVAGEGRRTERAEEIGKMVV